MIPIAFILASSLFTNMSSFDFKAPTVNVVKKQTRDLAKSRSLILDASVKIVHPSGGMGSGFLVRPDGWGITNNHVYEHFTHGEKLIIQMQDGSRHPATFWAHDASKDLALFKISDNGIYPFFDISTDHLLPGDTVVLSGWGPGTMVPREMKYIGENPDSQKWHDKYTPAIIPGDSGSAALSNKNEVAGVASARNNSTGTGLAVPAYHIIKFLQDNGFRK